MLGETAGAAAMDTRPYHHGDLRMALIEAGLTVARERGASALGLRQLTRVVGVTPNAAYRHFHDRQALVAAIAAQARDLLARAMLERIDAIPADAEPADRAVRRLRAVGLGYIHFALAEPGWFELALLAAREPDGNDPAQVSDEGVPGPFQLLLDALDNMVDTGALTSQRRVGAEWVCWSAVHGFADLVTRTELSNQPREAIDNLAAYVVDTVINGLSGRA